MRGRGEGDDGRAFLAGGGEMGALIRAHDWAATPLGPPERWPQALRTALRVLLTTNHPIFVFWGPEHLCFYNDAYRRSLGPERHPGALGRPGRAVWDEIWDIVGPQIGLVMAGRGATWHEDHLVPTTRHGRREEVYWTYSYGPIDDEAAPNGVGGVLVICTETTRGVLAERRLAFLLALEERLRDLPDAAAVKAAAAEMLGRRLGAVQVGYAEADAAGYATTAAEHNDGRMPSLAGQRFRMDVFGPALAAEQRAGRPAAVEDVARDARTAGPETLAAYAAIGVRALLAVPLVKDGRLVAFLFAAHPEPRAWSEEDVALMREVAERTWSAVERAQAEGRLREGEARFRNMADHAPVMVWTTDPDGRCTYLNRAWYRFTGQTEAEALGFGWLDATHPDDRPQSEEAFRAAVAAREAVRLEYRLRRADGAYRWAIDAAAPRLGEGGAFLGHVGTVIDIGERREAEERLRESRARLDAIVRSAAVGIAEEGTDGRLLLVNGRYCEILGRSEESLLGRRMQDLTHPEDLPASEKAFARMLETGEPFAMEKRYLRPDGSPVWVRNHVSAIRGPDGRPRRAVAMVEDVTEARRAAERQALLAREVDHRAKNALAVVQAALRLTRADGVEAYAKAIEGRVAALARAQTLLAGDRWAGADLGEMLRGELAPFLAGGAPGPGPRAALDGPRVALPAGAAQPLGMAVHELATNAVKHGALSAPTGRVSVSWRLEGGPAGVLRLRWAEAGGPAIAGPPQRRGFGSRVLDGTVRHQLGGAVSLDWKAAGLVCEVDVPLGRTAAAAGGGLAAAD